MAKAAPKDGGCLPPRGPFLIKDRRSLDMFWQVAQRSSVVLRKTDFALGAWWPFYIWAKIPRGFAR